MGDMTKASQNRWLVAIRPKTLWAAVCPVLVGSALAADLGAFHAPSALACLFGALLIQIGTNFANDYSDGVKGTDANRLGPPRAVASGLIHPQVMKGAIILTFMIVWIPGLYSVYRGGWPFLAIGIASIVSGLAYTGGPYPLGYNGLGDIFVLVFFGPVAVVGTFYLQAYTLTDTAFIASMAPGLFSVGILTVNNLRDMDGDRDAGKRTLAVRFGKTFAKLEYIACILGACFVVPAALVLRTGGHYWSLLAMAAFLPAIPAIIVVLAYTDPRMLNTTLAKTGGVLLIYSLLFSIGWTL